VQIKIAMAKVFFRLMIVQIVPKEKHQGDQRKHHYKIIN
jgi:hypothetical protein